MRFAHLLKNLFSFSSLKGRLLLGLSFTLLLLIALVLGMAWQLGKTMVQEANMSHLRYEATLLADEVTQQIDMRIEALERLSEMIGPTDDASWISTSCGRTIASWHGSRALWWPTAMEGLLPTGPLSLAG